MSFAYPECRSISQLHQIFPQTLFLFPLDKLFLSKTGCAGVPGEAFFHGADGSNLLRTCLTNMDDELESLSPRLKIVLSGSSSLEILDRSAETLAVRVQVLRIHPFSMSEASFLMHDP